MGKELYTVESIVNYLYTLLAILSMLIILKYLLFFLQFVFLNKYFKNSNKYLNIFCFVSNFEHFFLILTILFLKIFSNLH